MPSDRGLLSLLRPARADRSAPPDEVVVTAKPEPRAPLDPSRLYARGPEPVRSRRDPLLERLAAEQFYEEQLDRISRQINISQLLRALKQSQAKQELPRRRPPPELRPAYVREL